MRILLTGGHGFVGSHLVQRLVASGALVRCLHRRPSTPPHLAELGVETVRADLRHAAAGTRDLVDAFEGVDAVVHMAALTRSRTRREMRATNVGGTAALLAASLSAGFRGVWVLCSSLAAAGPSPADRPHGAPSGVGHGRAGEEGGLHGARGAAAGEGLAEPRRDEPLTWYGESKRAAEDLVRRHADRLDVRIVRPPGVYGPRDRDFLAVFRAADRGLLPVFGDPSRPLHLVYAADLAEALHAVLCAPGLGIGPWYPSHPDVVTAESLLGRVAAAVGRPGARRVRLPSSLLGLLGRAGDLLAQVAPRPPLLTSQRLREVGGGAWLCDASALQAATGWRARVDLEAGCRETVAWYRRAGWLPQRRDASD